MARERKPGAGSRREGLRGAVRFGAEGTAPGIRTALVTGEHRDRLASARRRRPVGAPPLPGSPPSHRAQGVLLWVGPAPGTTMRQAGTRTRPIYRPVAGPVCSVGAATAPPNRTQG